MKEHEMIERIFAPLTKKVSGAFGLNDDAAVFSSEEGNEIVITKDAIAEGVHFPEGLPAGDIARKLVRVNLSDIAAMGAKAKYYLMSATIPKTTDKKWFKEFAEVLAEEQEEFDISLIGGDTVSYEGKISLSLTMIGEVRKGWEVRRITASDGDDIYVSGTIGDAALGLAVTQGKYGNISEASKEYLISRYIKPLPRMSLGNRLSEIATAALDISDGLIIDSEHLRKGGEIYSDKIPLSDAAKEVLEKHPESFELIVTGGDDYEILFTSNPETHAKIQAISAEISLNLTKIGRVEGDKIRLISSSGDKILLKNKGFSHF